MKACRFQADQIFASHACRLAGLSILLLVSLALLPGCSGRHSPPPTPGMARLDAVQRDDHKRRIRSSRIVALNDRQFSPPRRKVEMPPGNNRVTLRFNWPGSGTTHANIRFRAKANRTYSVSYDTFPQCGDSGMTKLPEWIGEMATTPGGVLVALPLVPAVVAGDQLQQAAERSSRPTHYIDIFVISDNQAEGVVRRQRVQPGMP